MSGRPHRLKIASPTGHGHASQVELNGVDISGALKAMDLRIHAERINEAELVLFAPGVDLDGEFRVSLSEETRLLLKRLGWTPPEEAP